PKRITVSAYASILLTVTATPEIYTLSLHDALPIFEQRRRGDRHRRRQCLQRPEHLARTAGLRRRAASDAHECHLGQLLQLERRLDRKSTRLNSSHGSISYAVFCLKKKKNTHHDTPS